MRVTLFLRCRGVAHSSVELVSMGMRTDHRGIPVFTMPAGDVETDRIGTNELSVFNPEGRIPVLLLPDGRKLTQSGPIIDFIEETLNLDRGGSMVPRDPWARAQMRRIMWIVATDTDPYQNIPFIIQAMGEWRMTKAPATRHPLRVHFIRRGFAAMENIMAVSSGHYTVGDSISYADCFLVPQVRDALIGGIDLAGEFPIIARVWNNLSRHPLIRQVVDAAGATVQPYAFDEEKLELYLESPNIEGR